MNDRSSSKPAPPAPAPPIRTQKLRVLLVDDHPILVEGLSASINNQPDMLVCGSAPNARTAMEAVEKLRPNLVLVDISLEGSHGIELVKNLAARHPGLPMLVLSTHDETLYAERALRAGARGYVMKREPVQKLLEGIRKVRQGDLFFSEAVTARMLDRFAAPRSGRSPLPLDRLSDRELEILELLGQGRKSRQIADTLHISMKTVQAHCEHLKEKLALEDITALNRFAVQWVETDPRERAGG
jgi:DNA-binding NarL/FixJ family response regulator